MKNQLTNTERKLQYENMIEYKSTSEEIKFLMHLEEMIFNSPSLDIECSPFDTETDLAIIFDEKQQENDSLGIRRLM